MLYGAGKEGLGIRIVTILKLFPADIGCGVRTHHKAGGGISNLLCITTILESVPDNLDVEWG